MCHSWLAQPRAVQQAVALLPWGSAPVALEQIELSQSSSGWQGIISALLIPLMLVKKISVRAPLLSGRETPAPSAAPSVLGSIGALFSSSPCSADTSAHLSYPNPCLRASLGSCVLEISLHRGCQALGLQPPHHTEGAGVTSGAAAHHRGAACSTVQQQWRGFASQPHFMVCCPLPILVLAFSGPRVWLPPHH